MKHITKNAKPQKVSINPLKKDNNRFTPFVRGVVTVVVATPVPNIDDVPIIGN